jgi:hypothetical protein
VIDDQRGAAALLIVKPLEKKQGERTDKLPRKRALIANRGFLWSP